jgi:site-specific recombinase XerD
LTARANPGRPPDTASFEAIRRLQLHLAENGAADTPTVNHAVSALRFLFRVTLKRYAIVEHTHFVHEPRKLPVVLSPEEVARDGRPYCSVRRPPPINTSPTPDTCKMR